MNLSRALIDGFMMAWCFNAMIALIWLIIPNTFSYMLPSEIRKAAPKRKPKEVLILRVTLAITYIFLITYAIISAYIDEIMGFWNLFWTAYIEMFIVNLGDFFLLDLCFRKIMKQRIMIPGTEHCESWNTKKFLLNLGLLEHWILWPFIVCPVVALLCAGIGILIR
ncbi:hypothetical protein PIROE2DRAFT_2778 [Piromyces sp. E2]|nr:hypothetical protein PIROE2DRAFT_2778 [Piromyces sp. E2]|eukprot:OUM69281.1 hypothetical protein PIROE2DRAFT_2778 [Piromyces sp. E2]